jgi:hypothetical protein
MNYWTWMIGFNLWAFAVFGFGIWIGSRWPR